MSRNSYLRRAYGITETEYNAMVEAQGGKCAICRKIQRKKRLSVDHDHVTKTVRGALCLRCNEGIGRFEFSLDTLRRLLDYVNAIIKDRAMPLSLTNASDQGGTSCQTS